MKKEKVLHVLASNSFSGAENVVCTIIENNKDYDMFYCCPKGPIEKILSERKIKFIPISKLSIREISKVCKKNDINIIHAHDFKASFICAFSNFKGKVISHIHNNLPFIKRWNIYTILYRIACNRFHKVILVSKEVLEDAIFKKGINTKTVILNNVVDSKKVINLSKGTNKYDYDILFIGRLIELKNPILFIEILYELKKYNKNIKGAMIGAGECEEICRKKILELELSNNIDMFGFQSNPFPIIKNTKIVIMPSIYEGFGLTAIESMCLKKPVINSGAGGLNTIFKNNKEFICKSKNEYIKLILNLFKDKKLLDNYEDKCYTIIEPYININKWEEKINSLYK